MSRIVWPWIGVLLCLASGLVVLYGVLTVYHRQEQCVQAVLAAQRAHLSTWEAVEKCVR